MCTVEYLEQYKYIKDKGTRTLRVVVYVYVYTTRTRSQDTYHNSKKTSKKTYLYSWPKTCAKVYARAPARGTYLLRARCTSSRETLHDDSSKACAQLRAGVFRLSRASRRYRRSCPKSRFATFAYPSRGREHEREIPGSASSALMPGTRWCKKKSVAIPFEEGDRFRARVLARTLFYVFFSWVRFIGGFFLITWGAEDWLLYNVVHVLYTYTCQGYSVCGSTEVLSYFRTKIQYFRNRYLFPYESKNIIE